MNSPPIAAAPDARRSLRWALLCGGGLILLSWPLFFLALGGHGLSDPDEPYYAVPALEMLHSGRWLVTTLRGQPWFDKPILFYWMVIAGYRLIGVSETAARLGSAGAALAGLFVVQALGRRLGLGRSGSFAAALILATSLQYALMARAAVTDMALTMTIAMAMLAAAAYLASGSGLAAFLFGGAAGLAALTKGPVGLILPAAALGLHAVLARRSDILKPRGLLACAAGAALTAGPWYTYMALQQRDLLLRTFIGEGNVGRFLNPEHPSPPYYFLVVLAVGLLPWSGALPFAVAAAARPSSWRTERGVGHPIGPLYLLCWFAAPILVFSCSASKLPTYVLPALPPAALLIATYWCSVFKVGTTTGTGLAPSGGPIGGRRGVFLSIGLSAGIALAGGCALFKLLRDRGMDPAGHLALGLVGLLLAGAALTLPALKRGSFAGLLAALAAPAAAVVVGLVLLGAPLLEPYDSTRPLVRQLESEGLDRQVAGAYHVWDLSLNFYLGRTLEVVTDHPLLLRRVAASAGAVWVVRTRDLPLLSADPELVSNLIVRGPRRSAVRLAPAAAKPVQ